MNKVELTGNLGRNPDLSYTPSGTAVCKFSMAVQRRFKDQQGNYPTDWFNIVAFGKFGEMCANHLTKGSKVGIVGRLQTRNWEKDGVKHYATDIIAEELDFLNSKGSNGNNTSNSVPRPTPPVGEDLDAFSGNGEDLPF